MMNFDGTAAASSSQPSMRRWKAEAELTNPTPKSLPFRRKVLESLLCALCRDIMTDPVTLVETGNTY